MRWCWQLFNCFSFMERRENPHNGAGVPSKTRHVAMQVVGSKFYSRITQVPDSLFAGSQRFFDKSKARSRRLQNSPPAGLRQLKALIFRFA